MRALLAAVLTILPAAAQADTDVTSVVTVDRADPISIKNVTLGQIDSNTGRICLSWQNLTANAVRAVTFRVAFLDANGSQIVAFNVHRISNTPFPSGTTKTHPDPSASDYRDTNDGSQSCWTLGLPTSSATAKKIHITIGGLTYANGSNWAPGDTFDRAYAYTGEKVGGGGGGEAFVPEPFRTAWTTDRVDFAPIVVTGVSIRSYADRTFKQCVSYRNISNKTASQVEFSFSFRDADGNAVAGQNFGMSDPGTFTPPISIEDHCSSRPLPSAAVVRRMNLGRVAVSRVLFSDGSEWSPGQAYQKAFTATGQAYNGPQPSFANQTNDSSTVVTNSDTGANPTSSDPSVKAGVLGPTGPSFGSIAWLPGSRDVYGVAVDKGSLLDAIIDAINTCNEHAPDHKGCDTASRLLRESPQTGMTTGNSRCGVLAFDGGTVFALAYGGTIDEATKKAFDKISESHGSFSQTHVVAGSCNSR